LDGTGLQLVELMNDGQAQFEERWISMVLVPIWIRDSYHNILNVNYKMTPLAEGVELLSMLSNTRRRP
jgi:hypothetical protein